MAESYSMYTDYHVQRWSDDPYTRGAWSQIRSGGSPRDRETLAEPVDNKLKIAGEHTNASQPAMVHGAYISGFEAASWIIEEISKGAGEGDIVIVGAGAAGIGCGAHLRDYFSTLPLDSPLRRNVVILEASDRIGGRAYTVSVGGTPVDAGPTWLQQDIANPLIPKAEKMGLTLIPSDFNNPLSAAGDCPVIDNKDIADLCDDIACYAQEYGSDSNLRQVINEQVLLHTLTPDRKQTVDLALAELMSDTGIPFDDMSALWGLEEPGVGVKDRYIIEGYGYLLKSLSEGLDIRLHSRVDTVEWGTRDQVTLSTNGGRTLKSRFCIVTVPLPVLQHAASLPPSTNHHPNLEFIPPLPLNYLHSLSKLKMAQCNKVILKFPHRWWPSAVDSSNEGNSSGRNILKWYGRGRGEEPYGSSFIEILDMTDGCGCAVLVFHCTGEEAVKRVFASGRSDKEIANLAYDELVLFTRALTTP